MRKQSSYEKRAEEEESKGIQVLRRGDESIGSMLNRFKKKVSNSRILYEIKEREFYEKPSKKRKRKHLNAVRRRQNEEQKKRIQFNQRRSQ